MAKISELMQEDQAQSGMAPQGGPISQAAGEEEATPEEQQQYEQVVMAGIKMLTEATDQIMQLFQTSEDPAQAIADVTTMMVMQVNQQSQHSMPDYVLLHASLEILDNVAEFAEGVLQVDQNAVGRAAQITVATLADQLGIEIGEEELSELMASVGQEGVESIVREQQSYSGQQQPAAQNQMATR